MVRREGDAARAVELVQHALRDAALILAHVHELRASRAADRRDHGVNPSGERFLREQVVVERAKLAGIALAAEGEVLLVGKRHTVEAAQFLGRNGPGHGQLRDAGVVRSQPPMPRLRLHRVAIRRVAFPGAPGVRETRLVDEVPAQPGNVLEAIHDGERVVLLGAYGDGIQVGIRSGWRGRIGNVGVGKEGEEGEVHDDVMAARAKKVGFEVAQEPLAGGAGRLLDELELGHPHAGADEVHAVALHFGEVGLPGPCVARPGEIPAVVGGVEIVRAHREKGLAVASQKVSPDAERRARFEQLLVLHPEGVLVEFARLAAFFIHAPQRVETGGSVFLNATCASTLVSEQATRSLSITVVPESSSTVAAPAPASPRRCRRALRRCTPTSGVSPGFSVENSVSSQNAVAPCRA